MTITSVETDITTALTDYLLAAALIAMAFQFYRLSGGKAGFVLKRVVWIITFFFFAIAAVVGGSLKLFLFTESLVSSINPFLFVSVAVAVAFFCLGAVHDCWGTRWTGRLSIPLLLVALACLTSKAAFMLFYLIVMLFSLTAYSVLAVRREAGMGAVALGILVVISAAVARALGPYEFTLVYQFNQGTVFHLLQLLGMVSVYRGLVANIYSEQESIPAKFAGKYFAN